MSQHGVNMETPLTRDGFPRADIDVAQSKWFASESRCRVPVAYDRTVRTTRSRIIHLRNDHKALMAKIDKGLEAYFSASADQAATASTVSAADNPTSTLGSLETAFARVNSVVPGSPAAGAGMKAGDLVSRFGEADWLNHEKLSRVAQIVSQNEGVCWISTCLEVE